MKFLKRLLSGLGIGVGAAVPGVSGGTIAVILKVYEDLIWAISNLFKSFKRSIIIILPILIGVIVALIPCIILFNKALEGFLFALVTLFCGFIIGSFPSITKEVKDKPFNKWHIVTLVSAGVFAILLGVLSVILGDKINIAGLFTNTPWWFYLVMIPIGFLASVALVVPGISGSMILLIIGFYTPLINLASGWMKAIISGNWSDTGHVLGIIGCFAIGVLVGFYFISKLMNKLLTKYRLYTFYGIIGFIIGSTLTLYFNHDIFAYYQVWASGKYIYMPMYVEMLFAGLMFVIGYAISYALMKYQSKIDAIKKEE